MDPLGFSNLFLALTGTQPFPWQQALYDRFVAPGAEIPTAADLPTGLGKTSVVAIWLIALLTHGPVVPRRLVYVVNRRTVVDQTTTEVERLRQRLTELPELSARLQDLCAVPCDIPLALSTLRGQFADNREWSADPARPAVIVGTVDMIGSGLLFSRYTCGFKARPHHAAFLGQDALLVHDEAHLEPAFQTLLESIVEEQKRCNDTRPLHVLQLTATARGAVTPFGLTPEDEENELVKRRLKASKALRLVTLEDEKPALLADKLAELALVRRDSGRAVLVFARSVEVVQKIAAVLKDQKRVVLTGTMRGKEREDLIRKGVFGRFLPASSRPESAEPPQGGTCYLIATSAGEVGVNLSADDMICDLSTYESMAQRFGRVNRFGEVPDSVIEVAHPERLKDNDPIEEARSRTLDLMRQLNGDACPDALRKLKREIGAAAILEAFTPEPDIRPATDILFDAWAMTSIREVLPGRAPIAPYLHGQEEWQPPETQVAWRREVEIINDSLSEVYDPEDLLSEFPLKPHELLRDRSSRVRTEIEHIVRRIGEDKAREIRVWLISDDGKVTPKALADLAGKNNESEIENCTLLLPPNLGGLSSEGLLDGKQEPPVAPSLDVADMVFMDDAKPRRVRIFAASPDIPDDAPEGCKRLRARCVIDRWLKIEDSESGDAPPENERYWLWLEAPLASGAESIRSKESVSLKKHTEDVVAHARNIACKLGVSDSVGRSVILAARIHDLGKRRLYWQRSIGNFDKTVWLAKAGAKLRPRPANEPYRHEFGSLLDVEISGRLKPEEADIQSEFAGLTPEEKDIVLHLVAAHHGRGRPHFSTDETFDPETTHEDAVTLASEVPQRFARLQRRFGRWGLAYLESLLRSADYAASAEIPPFTSDAHE